MRTHTHKAIGTVEKSRRAQSRDRTRGGQAADWRAQSRDSWRGQRLTGVTELSTPSKTDATCITTTPHEVIRPLVLSSLLVVVTRCLCSLPLLIVAAHCRCSLLLLIAAVHSSVAFRPAFARPLAARWALGSHYHRRQERLEPVRAPVLACGDATPGPTCCGLEQVYTSVTPENAQR